MFELEADCTIPAEYILMMHFMGEVDTGLEQKIARYLRAHQSSHDGWPLYYGGELDLSCTIKVYWALKIVGDSPDAPHMARARAAILARGGAARANVFTRITLALFGQIPWSGVPFIPVEIMLLPRWFIFHLEKVAYWSRTVMVPLFILVTKRPLAKNPRGIDVRELFTTPPEKERHYFHRSGTVSNSLLSRIFLLADRIGRIIEPRVAPEAREEATKAAETWMLERLNGEGGLGAIFPAMVNALEVMQILGYPEDDPRRVTAKRAIDKLLVFKDDMAYCQPCVSPVWDTGLASLALQEAGDPISLASASRALNWLEGRQLLDEPGDWQWRRPKLKGGGWPFQFENGHYPDLDDTAVVAWAMHLRDPQRYAHSIERALNWLVGMQSSNGGFAAFDVDNNYYYLNEIPFADHGALLDPPTSDVTARVVKVLTHIGRPQDKKAVDRAIAFLRKEQEPSGSWFGRWGTNHIYGTWSVLVALASAGLAQDPMAWRAVDWFKQRQNADGGWGETNDSYSVAEATAASNAYQTAWAMLGMLAVGEGPSESIRRGADYLLKTQQPDGLWTHDTFTAPGFPRVFYLKYHGYCAYFPLWALAAYRKAVRAEHGH
jgi:squalene-hopene/tetraprenyl-beta-curcumene cyclase